MSSKKIIAVSQRPKAKGVHAQTEIHPGNAVAIWCSLLLLAGCDAGSQFERHEKAAWAIEAQAVEIIESVGAGGGPDDATEQLGELNKQQAAEVEAARAARKNMPKPPTRNNEIETLADLVKIGEQQEQTAARLVNEADGMRKVDAMLIQREGKVELLKNKRRLELLKSLYQD